MFGLSFNVVCFQKLQLMRYFLMRFPKCMHEMQKVHRSNTWAHFKCIYVCINSFCHIFAYHFTKYQPTICGSFIYSLTWIKFDISTTSPDYFLIGWTLSHLSMPRRRNGTKGNFENSRKHMHDIRSSWVPCVVTSLLNYVRQMPIKSYWNGNTMKSFFLFSSEHAWFEWMCNL